VDGEEVYEKEEQAMKGAVYKEWGQKSWEGKASREGQGHNHYIALLLFDLFRLLPTADCGWLAATSAPNMEISTSD
jgi:hypothetical protein